MQFFLKMKIEMSMGTYAPMCLKKIMLNVDGCVKQRLTFCFMSHINFRVFFYFVLKQSSKIQGFTASLAPKVAIFQFQK